MNDLTNRELIRRKFTFSEPKFLEKSAKSEILSDNEFDEEIHDGSLIHDIESELKEDRGPSKDLTSRLENRR